MKRWVRHLLALSLLLAASVPAIAGDLEPFQRGSYKALLAESRKRPVAVHFWSLTCAPCLMELPRWADTARAHPGAAIVLVNTDPPGDAPQVQRTLASLGLGALRTMQFADAFTDRLMFEVDPTWHGELPRTSLIAKGGKATKVLGTVDDAALRAWAKR
jgi:thiol-disulfide isomerase/thioredoxin